MEFVQMQRRIPNAVHFCDPWSSHATLLENPQVCCCTKWRAARSELTPPPRVKGCLEIIDSFLYDHRPRFLRASSFAFEEQKSPQHEPRKPPSTLLPQFPLLDAFAKPTLADPKEPLAESKKDK
jgi:hypothetical protein